MFEEQEIKEAVEPQEQPQENIEPEPQPVQENSMAKNFRILREKTERDAKELERLRTELEEARKTTPIQQQPNNDDRMRQLEAQVVETRIRSQYPDFDQVVNADNIAVLKAQHPELVSAITLTPGKDIYSTAAAAYTLMRKLGIAPEDTFVAEKVIAQKNAMKPRPVSSVSPQQGESPLSRANGFADSLTPERKAEIWKQMQEDMKRG